MSTSLQLFLMALSIEWLRASDSYSIWSTTHPLVNHNRYSKLIKSEHCNLPSTITATVGDEKIDVIYEHPDKLYYFVLIITNSDTMVFKKWRWKIMDFNTELCIKEGEYEWQYLQKEPQVEDDDLLILPEKKLDEKGIMIGDIATKIIKSLTENSQHQIPNLEEHNREDITKWEDESRLQLKLWRETLKQQVSKLDAQSRRIAENSARAKQELIELQSKLDQEKNDAIELLKVQIENLQKKLKEQDNSNMLKDKIQNLKDKSDWNIRVAIMVIGIITGFFVIVIVIMCFVMRKMAKDNVHKMQQLSQFMNRQASQMKGVRIDRVNDRIEDKQNKKLLRIQEGNETMGHWNESFDHMLVNASKAQDLVLDDIVNEMNTDQGFGEL